MGNVIGIVAEYNPFHNGHARLIEQTRAQLGAVCPVVCVMSGDFVQRGSPAVYWIWSIRASWKSFSEWQRTKRSGRNAGRRPVGS